MKVALFGFMGAGKTSFGKIIAKSLGYAFIDLDEAIEQNIGKSIPQIFEDDGEIVFRKIEHQALKDIVKRDRQNIILSLGGGTILQPANRKLLEVKNYTNIYLDVNLDILVKRLLQEKNKRPLLAKIDDSSLPQYIKALHFSRKNIYEKSADIRVNINEENFQQSLEKLYLYLNLN